MVGRTKCKLRIPFRMSGARSFRARNTARVDCIMFELLLLLSAFARAIFDVFNLQRIVCAYALHNIRRRMHIDDFVGDRGVWIFEGGSGVYLVYSAHVYFSPLSVDSRPMGRPTRSQPTVDRLSADCRSVGFANNLSVPSQEWNRSSLSWWSWLKHRTPHGIRVKTFSNASLKSTRATKMRRNWCEFCQSTLQATPIYNQFKVISCWTQTDLSLMQKAL